MTAATTMRAGPMSFPIDRNADEPLYRQLRTSIERGIATGSIDVDAPLPSSRQLAAELGLSRNTVNAAYQDLIAAGFLDSQPRRGLFVSPTLRANQVTRPAAAGETFDWNRRLHNPTIAGSPTRARSESRELRFPFVTGHVDVAAFPTRAWTKALAEALQAPHDRVSLAPSVEDDPMLLDMICRLALPARGIHATPDRVLVTMGSTHARTLITAALARPGLRVAYENPGPSRLPGVLRKRGVIGVPMPVDADGLIPPASLHGIDVLVVSPSHHQPTSVTLSSPRRRELLGLAAESGTIVVEHDDETELRYRGSPMPSLASLDGTGRVVYVGTFATVLAPGVTVGFIVGSPALIAALRDHRRGDLARVNGHVQRALALLISSGGYQTVVRQHRARMRDRWEATRTAVDRHLPGSYVDAGGGCSIWVTGPADLDCRRLEVLAARDGIAIERGDRFFDEELPPRNHFRLGFGAIPRRLIEPGIRHLAELIPQARVSQLRAVSSLRAA